MCVWFGGGGNCTGCAAARVPFEAVPRREQQQECAVGAHCWCTVGALQLQHRLDALLAASASAFGLLHQSLLPGPAACELRYALCCAVLCPGPGSWSAAVCSCTSGHPVLLPAPVSRWQLRQQHVGLHQVRHCQCKQPLSLSASGDLYGFHTLLHTYTAAVQQHCIMQAMPGGLNWVTRHILCQPGYQPTQPAHSTTCMHLSAQV